jgi:hypothetical protein
MTDILNFNRIWLVCEAHPDTDNGLMLGQRRASGYNSAPKQIDIDNWFLVHKDCCGYPDHFKLAHSKPTNWDTALSADTQPLKKGVKLAMVN